MNKLMILIALILATGSLDAKTNRDPAQRAAFMRMNPCPATGKGRGACKGYVVDHKKALACGGADAPYNMQWQTVVEGKAKDKRERKSCK